MLHKTNGVVLRRSVMLLLPALVLAACSKSLPATRDILDMVAQHLRETMPMGEHRVENLVLKSQTDEGHGHYSVEVDYDLVANMPSVELFNEVSNTGDRQHILGEVFHFEWTDNGWVVK